MASAQMDLDAQYSHDIEQAIAISKESAKEEMEESQAIAESEALAAENSVAEPYIADATMAEPAWSTETLDGLSSTGSAKEETEECEAMEELQALAAGNSPAEPEHTEKEKEKSGKESAMMTLRAILSEGSSSPTLRPSSRVEGSDGTPQPNDELSPNPAYVTISPRNTRQTGFLPDAPTTPRQTNGLPRPVEISSPSPAPMLADPEEVERLHELAEANHFMHEPHHPFREKPSRRQDYHSPMYIRDENGQLYVDTYEDDEVTGRRRYAPAEYDHKRRLPGEEGFVWANDADNRLQQEREWMDNEEAQGRGSEALKEARECAMQ